ncbi:ZIP family metal transporter [Winogradskyella sp. A3E31]|uniref:ZIP family metal transporter n=1 Tax=Winogradskyella sp. A3E31 TaxID=3349637 RepID=UPI00398BABBC
MLYILPICAIILGAIFAITVKETVKPNVKLLLAFSGAFLLAITLFELLPEVYENLSAKLTGVLIMAGIVIQIFLESLSKGAEHGHIHHHGPKKVFPLVLFISLCIHSLLEGIPINSSNDIIYGVVVHKIPIAIVITSFLVATEYSKGKIALFIILFAVMTPLGTLMAEHANFIKPYLSYINALVIGIFLHISTIILFESSEGHKFNLTKLFTIVLGVVIAYFV